MRHLTDIDSKTQAESFVAYLLTKGISTHVEPERIVGTANGANAESWSVWIRDEDRIDEARAELRQFLSNPNDERYRGAILEARTIINQQREEQKKREQNYKSVKMSRTPVAGGRLPPITLTLIIVCVIMGLITEFSHPQKGNTMGIMATKELKFVDMQGYMETNDPAYSLKKLELWRVFTPAFLHGGALHLLLNMLSLASLGRIAERMEGAGKYAIILVVSALGAHLLQGLLPSSLFGNPNFVGISGVVLGLFGYLAVKSKINPNAGFFFPPDAYMMVGLLVVIGFVYPGGLGMANMAHLGGLASGAILSFIMNR